MSGVLNCWFQTTCRFWTLLEVIWFSGEKRDPPRSPSPPTQLAPAGVTPLGSHDAGADAFCEADASATTVAPRSNTTMARPGNLRMQPLPPFSSETSHSAESALPMGAIILISNFVGKRFTPSTVHQ